MTTLEAVKVKTLRKKPLLPYKYEDRLRLPAYLRVRATFEEFIELSLECEYKVEYSNGNVVSIFETDINNKNILMGNASLTHEEIVGNIIFALNLLFRGNSSFHVHGSNTQTFVAENIATYNPDAVVVRGHSKNNLPISTDGLIQTSHFSNAGFLCKKGSRSFISFSESLMPF